MSKCYIRQANIEDYNSVEMIMRQVQKMHVEWRPDLYKIGEVVLPYEMYSDLINNENAIVAERNGNVVGFLFYEKRYIENCNQVTRNVIFVDSMGVEEVCRSQGIGRAMFDYIVEMKKKFGYDKIELLVNSNNLRAKEMYEKYGFKEKSVIMEM